MQTCRPPPPTTCTTAGLVREPQPTTHHLAASVICSIQYTPKPMPQRAQHSPDWAPLLCQPHCTHTPESNAASATWQHINMAVQRKGQYSKPAVTAACKCYGYNSTGLPALHPYARTDAWHIRQASRQLRQQQSRKGYATQPTHVCRLIPAHSLSLLFASALCNICSPAVACAPITKRPHQGFAGPTGCCPATRCRVERNIVTTKARCPQRVE